MNNSREKILEHSKLIFLILLRFAREHAFKIVLSAVVVAALWSTFHVYQVDRVSQLTLLSGPAGGAGQSMARKIASRIESTGNALGPRYEVTIEPTDGFEENRQRIVKDKTGKLFGFAQNGFGSEADRGTVKILLPLEPSTLHIMCSAEIAKRSTAERPVFLHEILGNISDGRAYLGPRNSGTRQNAISVLRRLKLTQEEIDRLDTNGIAGWHDMRAAFLNGSIQLAFCSTSKGSSVIKNIANDGKCILVSIADTAGLIATRKQFTEDTIPAHSYVRGNFCPTDVATINTRKVLISSALMSPNDAFLVTTAIAESLGLDRDNIPWDSLPPVNDPSRSTSHSYTLHSGSKRFKNDSPGPGAVPNWIKFFAVTILLWGSAELLKVSSGWLDRLDKKTAGNKSLSYDAIFKDVETTAAEMDKVDDWQDKIEDFKSRIKSIEERVAKGKRDNVITFREQVVLKSGIEQELQDRLPRRRPRRSVKKNEAKAH